MIELSLLYYVITQKDEMLLTQLDEELFLDTQAKAYLTHIKDNKEKSGKILTETDLEVITHTPKIFENTLEISDALVPFYLEQLTERYNKFKFFDSLYNTLQNDSSFEETVDEVQNIILNTGKQNSTITDIDCSSLDSINQEDYIVRKPLGFGTFDDTNKGLGISELCLLGGHRGSGKSILALHTAITRFKLGETVAFISIEMRSIEVGFRLDAMITGLPIKAIQFNSLNDNQKEQYFLKKALFYKKGASTELFVNTGKSIHELKEIYNNLPDKDHKFLLYDLPSCTLTDIAFIAQKLKKLHNLKYLVVDYLNIIKVPSQDDPIGWKTQIVRAEGLKNIAREYEVALLSPMQTDEDSKVKFAKAIEDPVDLSIIFKKAKLAEGEASKFSLFVSKIRNGTEMDFGLYFNRINLTIHRDVGSINAKS